MGCRLLDLAYHALLALGRPFLPKDALQVSITSDAYGSVYGYKAPPKACERIPRGSVIQKSHVFSNTDTLTAAFDPPFLCLPGRGLVRQAFCLEARLLHGLTVHWPNLVRPLQVLGQDDPVACSGSWRCLFWVLGACALPSSALIIRSHSIA